MLPQPFFPDPVFGWAFFGVIVGLAVVAAWFDIRHWRIPNALTVAALLLGLAVNAARGAWLAGNGQELWALEGGEWAGLFDGLLFSLAGFATGFGLFFLMWIIGACDGGDVKLFAALGAWLGPMGMVGLLIITLVLVVVLLILQWAAAPLFGEFRPMFKRVEMTIHADAAEKQKQERKHAYRNKPKTRLAIAYAPAVALAVASLLLWSMFRPPKPSPKPESAVAAAAAAPRA